VGAQEPIEGLAIAALRGDDEFGIGVVGDRRSLNGRCRPLVPFGWSVTPAALRRR
jgi:hypothetical protein